MFDEDGEVTPEQLNANIWTEIHTVPTREKYELMEKMGKFLAEEMEKNRINGITATAYS
jgi:hypothetical protein